MDGQRNDRAVQVPRARSGRAGRWTSVAVAAVAAFLIVTAIAPAATARDAMSITDVPVPSGSVPEAIVGDPGGGAWFAMPAHDRIGRIRPSGVVEEFPLPATYREPRGIAVGPDGGIWFTQTGGGSGAEGIGRIDGSGAFEEYPLPDGTLPYGIATGPDGNLWFTALGPDPIGRITPTGVVEMVPGSAQGAPLNITTGPDGALWFTEDGIVDGTVGAIGRVTTDGDLTEYVLPTPAGATSGAGDLAVGPDGNVWFTWVVLPDGGAAGDEELSIGRITPTGTIERFPIASSGGWPPGGITRGAEGDLWFTAHHADEIGRISSRGTVTTYSVPTDAGGPFDITTDADGTLWFTEAGAGRIGRIVNVSRPPVVPAPPTISSFAPASGSVGEAVAITGANLTGTSGVWFNGTHQGAYTVDPTGTLITTRVPAGATTGPLVIATPGGSVVSAASFVVTEQPAVHVRNVTLRLVGHLRATGRIVVADGTASCLRHRSVIVQRHVHGRWSTVGADVTDLGGRYTVRLADRRGWYRAVIREIRTVQGDTCAGAISGTRHHVA